MNDSKPSTIYTGVHDISKLAQYIQWDGHTHYLDTWPGGDQANAIRGTEGAFFKPNLKQGDSLELFAGDLQRSFDLVNTDTVNHFGFQTFRYKFSPSTYKGAFSEPDNSIWESWCPDGLFYIGSIKTPALPLYGSKPHFLDGDESLLEGVDGLSPTRCQHDSHMDIEPHVGANLDFSIKFQLNIRVNVSSDFRYGRLMLCNCDCYLACCFFSSSFCSFLEDVQGADESGSLFVPIFYVNQVCAPILLSM